VILSSADLDLLKAFDRNKDGHLDPEELELAQAAFLAYDPAAIASAASKVASSALGAEAMGVLRPGAAAAAARGAGAAAPRPVQAAPAAAAAGGPPGSAAVRNRQHNNGSSISFGGDGWDDAAARTRGGK
jgi:hypothetical protein